MVDEAHSIFNDETFSCNLMGTQGYFRGISLELFYYKFHLNLDVS